MRNFFGDVGKEKVEESSGEGGYKEGDRGGYKKAAGCLGRERRRHAQ